VKHASVHSAPDPITRRFYSTSELHRQIWDSTATTVSTIQRTTLFTGWTTSAIPVSLSRRGGAGLGHARDASRRR
jgi:hypothetical protein